MCFSATASIGASVVLTAVGVATIKQTTNKNLIYLAMIPLFFAIQQLSEGLVWLSLYGIYPFNQIEWISKYVFLFFAVGMWPVWMSLSLLIAETDPSKKSFLLISLLVGAVVSGVNIYELYIQKSHPEIYHHSIYYNIAVPTLEWLYFIATIFPCLISSLKNMWVVGVLIGISALAAAFFYYHTFVSVWCFFGAIVSIGIWKVIRDNRESKSETEEEEVVK
jgi:hypothetical protein